MKQVTFVFLLLASVQTLTASAQISVRSALADDRDAVPGTTYEGTVLIQNETSQVQQAKVYQTDYLFYHDGTNLYGSAGEAERSNADWIHFSPSVVTLPPGAMMPVQYTVTIPDDIEGVVPAGSYWSMLMVEHIPIESPESTLPSSEDNTTYGLRHVIRYGVQVASHVMGTEDRRLTFVSANLVREEASVKAFYLDLQNDGNRLVRPDLWMELYHTDGRRVGRREGVKNRIYPGTSIRQRFDLSDLPSGTYQALVVADPNGEDLVGARYTIEL